MVLALPQLTFSLTLDKRSRVLVEVEFKVVSLERFVGIWDEVAILFNFLYLFEVLVQVLASI